VIESLGEKVFELNNETVKTYLDIGKREDSRVKNKPIKATKKLLSSIANVAKKTDRKYVN